MLPKSRDEPLKVGLSGGAGCGKSFALNYLQGKGFKAFDCDKVVHQLLKEDRGVREMLLKRWGTQILTLQGHIDRSKIAAIVFNSDKELVFLEALLHPRVLQFWQDKIAKEYYPKDKWLVEVPLLFEKNIQSLFHFTVCIISNEELQIQRMQVRGLAVKEIQARIEKQMSLLEKMQKADFVIMNNGTQSFFIQQLDRLVELLF